MSPCARHAAAANRFAARLNRALLVIWSVLLVTEDRWSWRLVDVVFLLFVAHSIANEDKPRTCGLR